MTVSIGELNSDVVVEPDDAEDQPSPEETRQWVKARQYQAVKAWCERAEARTRARGFDD